ncbi:LysR family transcriptional regulator [Vibrio sinaloensis]|uniref:LysR family transcriptional regulator n=1 Tax=Photobacterium sp. (strain ATCC 43367) TaxID=379097 RepID=UPI00206CF3D5|nr:LysR family transcriptional regulator [Vibrio sinaloensis]UPQ89097.1 LysR family transcriptional regulator [Vibrio sinaloensis]
MDYIALSRISLKHLTVLHVLLSTHSVTAASEILCVTPSSVSKTLAQLRSQLDDELFYRDANGLLPTQFALNIGPEVHQILSSMNGILHQGAFRPELFKGSISLSMRESTFELFANKVAEITQQLTQARSITVHAKDALSFDALHRGQVDFMLLPHDISQPPTRSQQLMWQQILADEMVCLMKPDHPLVGNEMTIDAYLACNHIGILDKDLAEPYFEQNLTQRHGSRNIALSVSDFGSAATLCHHTELLLTCSKMWAQQAKQAQGLVSQPLPFEYGQVAYSLVWNPASLNDPALRWVHQQLTQV